MEKVVKPSGKWDDLRKTINFTEEEEKEMRRRNCNYSKNS